MSAELQFKQIIDRILRCREAEDAAKEDTKEVYAELKALGYDKTAAGALVAELRKKDKNPDKFEERNATLDLYRDAYDRASGTVLATHVHTREANEYAAAKGAANELQHPVSRATGEPANTPTRPGGEDSMVRGARTEAAAVTAGETATNHPVPVPPEVDGGQPYPSTDEAPAGQGGDHHGQSVHQSASAAQDRNEPVSASGASAPIPDADVPAFLKPKKDGCLQDPCKIAWTSALCASCSSERAKAKPAGKKVEA